MEKNKAVNDPKVILSTLWIFYVLNILYADVLNLMSEAVATTSEAEELINTLLSPEMLLSTAIFFRTCDGNGYPFTFIKIRYESLG